MALDFSGSQILGDAPMVFSCTALRSWNLDFIFLEPEALYKWKLLGFEILKILGVKVVRHTVPKFNSAPCHNTPDHNASDFCFLNF